MFFLCTAFISTDVVPKCAIKVPKAEVNLHMTKDHFALISKMRKNSFDDIMDTAESFFSFVCQDAEFMAFAAKNVDDLEQALMVMATNVLENEKSEFMVRGLGADKFCSICHAHKVTKVFSIYYYIMMHQLFKLPKCPSCWDKETNSYPYPFSTFSSTTSTGLTSKPSIFQAIKDFMKPLIIVEKCAEKDRQLGFFNKSFEGKRIEKTKVQTLYEKYRSHLVDIAIDSLSDDFFLTQ